MEIFFPLLCYNQTCNANYMLAVISLIQKCQELNVKLTLYPIMAEALVSRGRNAAVAHFMGSSATHMFFVDSDIIFNPADVFKLLNSGKSVIGGVYPKKFLKTQNNALQVEFNASGQVGLEGDICLVDYVPSGFLCIRRDAIEKLIEKNPDLKYTNSIEGYHSNESVEYYYDFFKPGVDPGTKQYMGEDFGFCNLLKLAEVPMYVYPNITLAHVGQFNYIGNFQDLINAQMAAQSAGQSGAQSVGGAGGGSEVDDKSLLDKQLDDPDLFLKSDDSDVKSLDNSVIIEEDEEEETEEAEGSEEAEKGGGVGLVMEDTD